MAGMRKNKTMSAAGRKVIVTMSALLIVAGASVTANAADVGTQNRKQGGENTNTEVYLGVARENSADVSFEVPLYYTMAIVKADSADHQGNASRVLQPMDDSIKNTTYEKDANGNDKENALVELAVASVRIKKAPYSNWDVVDSFTGTETATDRKMKVSIGRLPMPSLEGKKDGEYRSAEINKYDSVFYNLNTGKYRVIGDYTGDGVHDGNHTEMNLDVDIQVQPSYIPKEFTKKESRDPDYKEGSTVAQFQIMYMLTPLDNDGKPIGKYDQLWIDEHYVGPEKETGEGTP